MQTKLKVESRDLTEQNRNSSACVSEMLDEEIVRLICLHDENALSALVQRYGGQVQFVCKSICGDELEASGVVSEVFWEFWRQADLFQAQRGSLRTYLLTMARSRSIDRLRAIAAQARQRSRYMDVVVHSSSSLATTGGPEFCVVREENLQEIKEALRQLPDLQRQMLELAFFEGNSHREVAGLMKLPLGTVKTHIRKGLLKLRHLLSELSTTGIWS